MEQETSIPFLLEKFKSQPDLCRIEFQLRGLDLPSDFVLPEKSTLIACVSVEKDSNSFLSKRSVFIFFKIFI